MRSLIFSLVSAGLVAVSGLAATAEEKPLTEEEIIKRLQEQAKALQSRGLGARISNSNGEYVAVDESQRVDIRITFDLDSARLRRDQFGNLSALCGALASNSLAQRGVVLIGHTDAYGSESYNNELSERRAQSVLSHLEDNCNISSDRLTARGEGEKRLLDTDNPNSPMNRRVEIQIASSS